MNCPSRVDETIGHDEYNQQPNHLPADLTTNSDLNNVSNMNRRNDASRGGINTFNNSAGGDGVVESMDSDDVQITAVGGGGEGGVSGLPRAGNVDEKSGLHDVVEVVEDEKGKLGGEKRAEKPKKKVYFFASAGRREPPVVGAGPGDTFWKKALSMVLKYAKFMGPGFMISVSYMDPGNYATDVAAGAAFRFSHLFVILLANILAIFLQSLCVKLGSVTGVDLAENCKRSFPRWLCWTLYFFAEAAIIATDMAEVIGSAIALNILLKVPLVAGCAITILDTFIVLWFYNADGPVKHIRWFEFFVALLVFGVVICFAIELAHIEDTPVGEVFRGYLPSKAVASGNGLYLSCGILGATVMPHSLFLGSGIVQARMKEYDNWHANESTATVATEDTAITIERKYKPTLEAIRYTMPFCITDMAVSLFTCALFANSAILIVSAATLSDTPEAQDADLFSIYELLVENLGKAAGILFAVALLFSGESAGIVVTLAGQMISEGFLNWRMRPWLRRLITRAIAILPSIVVAGAVGRRGLAEVLNASQVTLSIILPFVTAPLIWLTCRAKYMQVEDPNGEVITNDQTGAEDGAVRRRSVDMSNNWFTCAFAVVVWGFIAGLNVYLIITLAMGNA
ncbi:hypothetical protein TWF569_010311 [Orbilia oligospora]|uniref:Manganese transporter smf1 n=2 Tax=Orbilia oligospora TaxID=2813651 RepID=A0A7C8NHP8_ORBOL|nr:hypothetical protein TWF706_006243 [Orbilia oligospora]KAF3110755.1 hypothetical protein TWF103_004086 [Orbilia oligospora]KAF3113370.1 hypothetical protein TWF102_000033 [Orbilia oligospora]KAF3133921.1 hypothetical protein TWF569_010311 [Orbilia oligospora]